MSTARPSWLLSRLVVVGGLVVVWALAWGELSAANVLSGIAVAVVVLALFPLSSPDETNGLHIRPLRVVPLVAFFALELVQSTLSMARDILGPSGRMRTGILAYPLRVQSDVLLTFLANVTALTPGAMPVDVDHEPKVLYIHVTRMHERATTERNLARYEVMFLRAFGSPAQLAALEAADGPGSDRGTAP